MRKWDLNKVRQLFIVHGYTLLADSYTGYKDKMSCVCPQGHTYSVNLSNFLAGKRCGYCRGRGVSTEEVKQLFSLERYTLLTQKVTSTKQKLECICPLGHLTTKTLQTWRYGHRCSECIGNKAYTLEHIKAAFSQHGYTLLANEYRNAKHKIAFECPNGHRGAMTWDEFNNSSSRCNECSYDRMRGQLHYNYNPLKTDEERKGVRGGMAQTWRKQVFTRDLYTCQCCGDRGVKLEAHHLFAYNAYPEMRWLVGNGVTLCKPCHRMFHDSYGRGNNTISQFEDFTLKVKHELRDPRNNIRSSE